MTLLFSGLASESVVSLAVTELSVVPFHPPRTECHPCQDAAEDCQVLPVIQIGSRVGRNQRVKECSPGFRIAHPVRTWYSSTQPPSRLVKKKKDGDSHLFRITLSKCEEP